jgi:hypothetical protein
MSSHRNQTFFYALISGFFIGALGVGLWMWFAQQARPDLNPQSNSAKKSKAFGVDLINDSEAQAGSVASAISSPPVGSAQLDYSSTTPVGDAESGSPSLSQNASGLSSPLTSTSVLTNLGASIVQVYELLPQEDGQLPPADLMQQSWKYAHLTNSGGVVSLESGGLVTWDVSVPGALFEMKIDSKLTQLKGTPQVAIGLDQKNQVWRIATRGESRFDRLRDNCHDIYSSSHAGKTLVKTAVGELVVLDLNRPSSGKLIAAPPGVNVRQAILTASMTVWMAAGQLWRLDLRYGGWQQQPSTGDEVSPMGDGAIVFNEEGHLYSVGGADPPPDLPATRLFVATNGIAVSMDHDRNATVWGARLPEGVRKIKLSPTTNNIVLGPSGLLIAW